MLQIHCPNLFTEWNIQQGEEVGHLQPHPAVWLDLRDTGTIKIPDTKESTCDPFDVIIKEAGKTTAGCHFHLTAGVGGQDTCSGR